MKSTNTSFRTIYEAAYEGMDSAWNMGLKITPLIQDLIDIIQKNDQTPARIKSSVFSNVASIYIQQSDVAEEYSDWKNIAFFEELLKLKDVDWSTEAVGSFFIKSLKNIKADCRDIMVPLVNNLFKLPKQNISLTDIAVVYTAMDYSIFNTEGHFDDSPELNNSLKACLEDVQAKSFHEETTTDMFINKDIGISAKYMEPSPCLNLTKFPKCNHYCTWHKKLFEDMPKNDFLTIMKYGLPQRKIR